MKLCIVFVLTVLFITGAGFANCNTCGIIKDGTCPIKCSEPASLKQEPVKKKSKKPKKAQKKKESVLPMEAPVK
ncbi:MAG: hypothetical protein LHV68_06390 [Elusimicrobia bacterium]|nr:hypothetical protein [Candidatus Liberimonas magnetica]